MGIHLAVRPTPSQALQQRGLAMQTIYISIGIVVFALLVYLTVALIKPEIFS
jgi:K+-transporting ATPase KdpF subunit